MASSLMGCCAAMLRDECSIKSSGTEFVDVDVEDEDGSRSSHDFKRVAEARLS